MAENVKGNACDCMTKNFRMHVCVEWFLGEGCGVVECGAMIMFCG